MADGITLRMDPEQPYQGKTRYIAPDGQKLVVPSDMAPHLVADSYAKMQASGTLPPIDQPLAPPTPTGMLGAAGQAITQGYQTVRGGVGKAVDFVDTMGGIMTETPKALNRPPASQTHNPLPPDLTTGLAETALGVFGGNQPGIRGTAQRMTAALGGAAAGGVVEGKSPMEIATSPGVVGAGVGEVAGKGQELVRRAWTHFTGALYAGDAKKLAETIGDLVPTLKGAKSADELRDLVMTGKGKKALLDMIETSYDKINQIIVRQNPVHFGQTPRNPLIPHAGQPLAQGSPETPSQTVRVSGHTFTQPAGPIDPETQRLAADTSTRVPGHAFTVPGKPAKPPVVSDTDEAWAKRNIERNLNIPSAGGLKSFDDVRGQLKESFRKGFLQGQQSSTPGQMPNPEAEQARQKFFAMMAELEPELGRLDRSGKAMEIFREARGEFRRGINIIDMLYRANGQSNRLFSPEGFQTKRLQTTMAANEEAGRRRLGPMPEPDEMGADVFDALANIVTRGGKLGTKTGFDTPGVNLGHLLFRSQMPLSGGAFTESLPKLSIPNYAGSPKPFTLSPEQQAILDLLMQQGLAKTGLMSGLK